MEAVRPIRSSDLRAQSQRTAEIEQEEQRDREGYKGQPQRPEEFTCWEAESVWPSD